jgi:hypothetical protein
MTPPASCPVETLRRTGVYFYFPEKTISEDIDQYTTMIIVDGLRELGVPCFANVAHPWLVEKSLGAAAEHLVVLDLTESNYSSVLMDAFAKFQARAKLIHSRADSIGSYLTPGNIVSLFTHENRFLRYESPRAPWAFGLSRRWLARHAEGPSVPLAQRRPVIQRNFRPASAQGVRHALDFALLPHLEKHFEIDRTIDVATYPARLATSLGCLAYCGEFQGDLGKNAYFRNSAAYQPLMRHRAFLRDPVIMRWDSWRFWESLAAGCLTFQLDFEAHGFVLPVMPIAWRHYVPLDFANLKTSVAELLDRRAEWAAIAEAGRAWALAHYTPRPTAERFAALGAAALEKNRSRSAA